MGYSIIPSELLTGFCLPFLVNFFQFCSMIPVSTYRSSENWNNFLFYKLYMLLEILELTQEYSTENTNESFEFKFMHMTICFI